MRNLMAAIITAAMLLSSGTAWAGCNLEGPHNCMESNEDALIALTRNTIDHMQFAHEHAFKTQNDRVLEEYARNHAQLDNALQMRGAASNPVYPLSGF